MSPVAAGPLFHRPSDDEEGSPEQPELDLGSSDDNDRSVISDGMAASLEEAGRGPGRQLYEAMHTT